MQRVKLFSRGKGFFLAVYSANFFLSLSFFATVYINSSYLETHVETESVGFLYATASLLSILFFLFISEFLTLLGNVRFTFLLSLATLLATLGLGLAKNPSIIFPLFVCLQILLPLILFCLDLFLESETGKEGATGEIRGAFLTVTNVALIAAPLAAGAVLATYGFFGVYALAAVFLFPLLIISGKFMSGYRDPLYQKFDLAREILEPLRIPDLRRVISANLLLQVFYAIMVVYLPLFLTRTLGFSWEQIAVILPIMLLPFLLFEFPAGALADKYWGEKEMMVAGFLIMGVFTVLLGFFHTASVSVFAVATILFFTRVGASLVEITTESYFFKKTAAEEADRIGIFRMTRPLSFLIGPLIGSIVLMVLPLQALFVGLGALLFIGAAFGAHITDTK